MENNLHNIVVVMFYIMVVNRSARTAGASKQPFFYASNKNEHSEYQLLQIKLIIAFKIHVKRYVRYNYVINNMECMSCISQF